MIGDQPGVVDHLYKNHGDHAGSLGRLGGRGQLLVDHGGLCAQAGHAFGGVDRFTAQRRQGDHRHRGADRTEDLSGRPCAFASLPRDSRCSHAHDQNGAGKPQCGAGIGAVVELKPLDVFLVEIVAQPHEGIAQRGPGAGGVWSQPVDQDALHHMGGFYVGQGFKLQAAQCELLASYSRQKASRDVDERRRSPRRADFVC